MDQYTPEKIKESRIKRDAKILRYVDQDMTYAEIAKLYGISRQRVHQIVIQQRAIAALLVVE